jgi:hypothetical protein
MNNVGQEHVCHERANRTAGQVLAKSLHDPTATYLFMTKLLSNDSPDELGCEKPSVRRRRLASYSSISKSTCKSYRCWKPYRGGVVHKTTGDSPILLLCGKYSIGHE